MNRARVFDHDITTDEIHPGRFYSTDEKTLVKGLMAGIQENFYKTIEPEDVLVAGRYFGMGSGRESAVQAIKLAGIKCVIAESFSRYFYRNCINHGIYPLELEDALSKIKEGDQLEILMEFNMVRNRTQNTEMFIKPLPEMMIKIIMERE